jgi:hypothetical protein
MLGRDRALRVEARHREALAAAAGALTERSHFALYIADVLSLADDLSLVVLHLAERRGYRLTADLVRNNFHLFTLLQAELIAPGRLAGDAVDPRLAAVARGGHFDDALSDHARWGFYGWSALQPDGTTEGIQGFLWGEATPLSIPELDGARVVLLGPPVLGSRSWDANLIASLHDAFHPHATVVEELAPARVEAWFSRILAARRPG